MEQLEEAQAALDELAQQVAAHDERLAELPRAVRAEDRGDRRRAGSRHRRAGAATAGHARGPAGALRQAAGQQGRRGCGRAARPPVRRLPAGHRQRRDAVDRRDGPPTWSSAARSASGSWSAPPSPAVSAGPTSVVIEADGGSRGNPGPAAYGAVLKDAATGAVIAEDAARIGRGQQQRGRVPGPDRRAPAGGRARSRCHGRGTDGLQARRRADVGALEGQAPDMQPLPARGARAGAGRHDLHLGAAGARTPMPTGWPTRPSTACASG